MEEQQRALYSRSPIAYVYTHTYAHTYTHIGHIRDMEQQQALSIADLLQKKKTHAEGALKVSCRRAKLYICTSREKKNSR